MDKPMFRGVSPRDLKTMLADGGELALIDLREELIFSRGHLLHARSLPLSRLELRMARLVPRHDTRIVLCDDADGLAEHKNETPSITADELDRLMSNGTDLVVLDSRPLDEYMRMSIPTAINVPG